MKPILFDFFLWFLSLSSFLFYFIKKVNLLLLYGIVFLVLLSLFRFGWILCLLVYRRKDKLSFYLFSILSLVMNGANLIVLFFLFLLVLGFTGSH